MAGKAIVAFEGERSNSRENESTNASFEVVGVTPLMVIPPPTMTMEERLVKVAAMNRAVKEATKKWERKSRSKYLLKPIQGGGEPLAEGESYDGSLVSRTGNVCFHKYTTRTTVSQAPRGEGEGEPVPTGEDDGPTRFKCAKPTKRRSNQVMHSDAEEPTLPQQGLSLVFLNTRINALRNAHHFLHKRVAKSNLKYPSLKRKIEEVHAGLEFKIERLAKACGKSHVIDPKY